MHLGHYPRHVDFMTSFGQSSEVQGFFNAAYWIRFITVGAALWLQSLPAETHSPCCDLSHIGGDGTGIGISTSEVFDLKPIWQPDDLQSTAPISWGRLDRCFVTSPSCFSEKKRQLIAEGKKLYKDLLSNQPEFRVDHRVKLLEYRDVFPVELFNAMTRWLGDMDEFSDEWKSMRTLLKACVSDESVLGVITNRIADLIRDVLLVVNPQRKGPANELMQKQVWKKLETIELHGMGDDIAKLIQIELAESDHFSIHRTSYGIILSLGE